MFARFQTAPRLCNRLARGAMLSQPARNLTMRKGFPKTVTAEEAASIVQSNSRVFVHGVAAIPRTLLNALVQRHDELRNVELIHIHLEGENPCTKYPAAFFVNNFFVGPTMRGAVSAGTASYVPVFLSEVPKLMRHNICRPNVAFLNVSPPDKHGFCSLGVEVATSLPAAETADVIVAQINPNMPRTHGRAAVHINSIDYIVPNVDDPLPQKEDALPNETNTRIGNIIAGLISDGSTLQMGIGEIPNAVLASLQNHKDLGIHTEMFQEGVIPLLERGVVNNLKKRFLPGRVVTSFIMGSKRMYDFVDDNVEISFLESSLTNNPTIIGSNPKVTAINSAVEVDLTGQVCADSIGPKIISGVGGQVDFERGAALSRGGLPIICLPSTTKTGQSRIVSALKPGAGITTTRNHVHYIVTEWGYANLFGKNVQERARALIQIAHPKFREQLEKEAFERFGIKAWRIV